MAMMAITPRSSIRVKAALARESLPALDSGRVGDRDFMQLVVILFAWKSKLAEGAASLAGLVMDEGLATCSDCFEGVAGRRPRAGPSEMGILSGGTGPYTPPRGRMHLPSFPRTGSAAWRRITQVIVLTGGTACSDCCKTVIGVWARRAWAWARLGLLPLQSRRFPRGPVASWNTRRRKCRMAG